MSFLNLTLLTTSLQSPHFAQHLELDASRGGRERTFESGRTNGKPENWRPGQNQAWTKNGILQSIPLIPNLAWISFRLQVGIAILHSLVLSCFSWKPMYGGWRMGDFESINPRLLRGFSRNFKYRLASITASAALVKLRAKFNRQNSRLTFQRRAFRLSPCGWNAVEWTFFPLFLSVAPSILPRFFLTQYPLQNTNYIQASVNMTTFW